MIEQRLRAVAARNGGDGDRRDRWPAEDAVVIVCGVEHDVFVVLAPDLGVAEVCG